MPPAPRPAAVRPSPSNRAKMAARGTGGARARARAGPTNGSAERRGRRPSPGDIERRHAPSPRARRSAERWMTSRAFRAPPRPCPRRAPPLAADWWRGGGGGSEGLSLTSGGGAASSVLPSAPSSHKSFICDWKTISRPPTAAQRLQLIPSFAETCLRKPDIP